MSKLNKKSFYDLKIIELENLLKDNNWILEHEFPVEWEILSSWWLEKIIRVSENKNEWLYLSFLVDPQWEINMPANQKVWAINISNSASEEDIKNKFISRIVGKKISDVKIIFSELRRLL